MKSILYFFDCGCFVIFIVSKHLNKSIASQPLIILLMEEYKMKKTYALFIVIILVVSSYVVVATTISQQLNNYDIDIKNDNEQQSISRSEENITISFTKAPLFLGVNIEIQNKGLNTLEDVKWSFRAKPQISGTGLVYNDQIRSGTIDQLDANELVTIPLRPLKGQTSSPFGLGLFYFNASVTTSDSFYRSSQLCWLILILMINLKSTYTDIPPIEAFSLYENGTFDVIIDVVGLNIYSLGHLPGAVNYIWADGTLNETIPTLDKNLTYLVYCHTDPPSTASAQAMVNAGFPYVYRLEGNYRAWVDAGYPIET
jgi:rhodanese-related sulfurtransferase